MTTSNKAFKSLLGLGLALALFSCNSSDTKKDETVKPADTTATTAAVTPASAPAFTPIDVVEVTHTVKDYATWRPMFDSDSTNRKAAGLYKIAVGRDVDHPNNILIAMKMDDAEKAKALMADPKMKATMDKAGVISKPGEEMFHVLRMNSDSHEKQWMVISHKVKDYDAWLKAFDGEGTAARASQGLTDVVLARGLGADSNNVHLVFDITDMAKAKASMMSEDKKKLMESAGVIGTPKIVFYNDVNE